MTSDNISPDAPPREKYVFKPRPGSSHHWALATLRFRISGAEVLDIGAGAGFVGRARGHQPSADFLILSSRRRVHER
jgi:hypothetical protein